MGRINVLVTRSFFEDDLKYLRHSLREDIKIIEPLGFSNEEIAAAVDDSINVFLGSVVNREMLQKATGLQVVQVPWTGVENMNFSLLREHNITLCNSHSNSRVVAEYAVALMMSVIKHIPMHDRSLREGVWLRPTRDKSSPFMPPISIYHKTIGFLGYGAIAREIKEMLKGFYVRTIAIDRCMRKDVDLDYLGTDINYLFKESDIIFITLPLTGKTRGIVNLNVMGQMKPTAVLINVSRGEIINEEDLFHVLSNNIIYGAAIDTWYQYPAPDQSVVYPSKLLFHGLDNIVMSPHRAGFSLGLIPHLDDVVENLTRLSEERPLINIVNLEEGF